MGKRRNITKKMFEKHGKRHLPKFVRIKWLKVLSTLRMELEYEGVEKSRWESEV